MSLARHQLSIGVEELKPSSLIGHDEAPGRVATRGPGRWRSVQLTFALLIVAMIVLQKVAIGGVFGINVCILYLGLAALALQGVLEIAIKRLLLWLAVLIAIVLGLLLNGEPLKPTGLAILVVMYSGFVLRVRVPRDIAEKCLDVFQVAMAVIASIVIMQQVAQYTIGNRYWPNLNLVIPKSFQYIGFAYIRPYTWNSPFNEPNGVFFLEPSVVSAYLAAAIVLEIVCFRRMLLVALLFAGMAACLAGTGPAAVALTTPLLMLKLPRKVVLIGLLISVPLVCVAVSAGLTDRILARSGEFSNPKSSGYTRITKPLQGVADEIQEADHIFAGLGPGQAHKGINEVEWPFSKLFLEYGFVTVILFHVYLLYCLFSEPFSRVLSFAIVIPHLFFGGGFVSHANIMLLMLLGSLVVVVEGSRRNQL